MKPKGPGKVSLQGPEQTPIRAALCEESSLRRLVCDGLGALKSTDHKYLEPDLRPLFRDSLDLDAATASAHPQDNRWDYLLGHSPSGRVIGVEPHSARSDQVGTVIAKKVAASRHLQPHLQPKARVASWIWVAAGQVDILHLDRARLRLAQHGVQLVGKQLRAKDLAHLSEGPQPIGAKKR
jgi:hypothetical protein